MDECKVVLSDRFDWSQVEDVLLDMDGTLLDRHFDNFFFEEELPRRYARKHHLALDAAREKLFSLYRAVEGELDWTDLYYWTRTLGIDLIALTHEYRHMIGFLPGAEEFLRGLKAKRKRVSLITNAHASGVSIKAVRTGLDRHVDGIITAFDVGYLKMRPEYWPNCRRLIGFDPPRTLYVDDDESCLDAARRFGIGFVYHSAKSSSQLPATPSTRHTSINDVQALL